MEKQEASSIDYITLMSVVSALAVVGLHTNGVFWDFSKQGAWFSANIIECVLYFAVPVFFMISGVTLMDFSRRYDWKTYAKKRIRKTFVPFVFWSLVMGAVLLLRQPTGEFLEHPIFFLFNGVFGTRFIPIYWFFPPLFCIYAVLPFFSCIGEAQRKKVFCYLLSLAFVLDILLPFLLQVFEIPFNDDFYILAGRYIVGESGDFWWIYPLLGDVLSKTTFSRRQRMAIYALALAGLALHLCGTYTASMAAGKIVKLYKGYLNVPCILYSTGVFVLLRQVAPYVRRTRLWDVVRFLQPYTFAIYLLQFFFLEACAHVFNTERLAYRLGGIVLITLLCVVATYVIRKLPGGRRVLP